MNDEVLTLRLQGPGLTPFRSLENSIFNLGYNHYNNYGGGHSDDSAYFRFLFNFCMQPSASATNKDVVNGKWISSVGPYIKCPLAYGPAWQTDYGGAYSRGYPARYENGMNSQLSSCPVLNDEAGFSDGMGNLMPTGPGTNPAIIHKTLPSWVPTTLNTSESAFDGKALWKDGRRSGFNPCQDRFALAAHAIAESGEWWRKTTSKPPPGGPNGLQGKIVSGNDQGAMMNVQSVTQAEAGEFRYNPFFPNPLFPPTYRGGSPTVSQALVSFEGTLGNFKSSLPNTRVYWYCRSGIKATSIGPTIMKNPTANDGFTCTYSLKARQIPNYDAIQTFAKNGNLSDTSTLQSLETMVARYCSVSANPGSGLGVYPRLIDGGRTSKYFAEICDRDTGFQFLSKTKLSSDARRTFRANVYDEASKLFCKNNPLATVCKCINASADPTFAAYQREYASANVPTGVETCWWIPCMMRSYQSDKFLVPSETRHQACSIKFPPLVCVNVLKVDGKDANIQNMYVNQQNRCTDKSGGDGGAPTPSPAPTGPPGPDASKVKGAIEKARAQFMQRWDTLTPMQQKGAMLIAVVVVLYLLLSD